MTEDLWGQACALMAAMTWAMAMVFFKRSGERIPPLAMNLFKNIIGMALLGVMLAGFYFLHGEGIRLILDYPRENVYILILSGIIGIALADTLFFYGLNLVGVGTTAMIDCLYSPIIIGTSWLILSEHLTVSHYVGGVLILIGIFISSSHASDGKHTRRELILGAFLLVMALFSMAFGIVLMKPVLDIDGYPLFWATEIRMFFGTAALMLCVLASPRRRSLLSVFRPTRVWWFAVPGSVLGGFMAMIFWMAGFKYTNASVAAILNQMATIFALILAAMFLKETFSRRKAAAVSLAMTGVFVVVVGLGPIHEWASGLSRFVMGRGG